MKKGMTNKKIRRIIAGILMIVLTVLQSSVSMHAEAVEKIEDQAEGFIQTEGQKLVDENGKQYIIKGINFYNQMNKQPSLPPTTDHDEASFQEIAEMGFNSVRFYLNYQLFEEDNNPYVYKETGFAWIDQNIKWAKKYGIRLVLDMHITQESLWDNQEQQNRLACLHGAIAKRYAKEPTILGYGLKNEPAAQSNGKISKEENLSKIYNQCIEKIREVDHNHIIFVERVGMLSDADFSIQDDNWVYEAHMYDTIAFTHQGVYDKDESSYQYVYPTINEAAKGQYKNLQYGAWGERYSLAEAENWQQLSASVTITEDMNEKTNHMYWQLMSIRSGEATDLYLDDIQVEEYDENGTFIRTLYEDAMDSKIEMGKYITAKANTKYARSSASISYDKTQGHKNAGAMKFTGNYYSAQFYLLKDRYLNVKRGYTYKVKAWVKVENPESNTHVGFRINTGSIATDYEGAFLTKGAYTNKNYGKWGNIYKLEQASKWQTLSTSITVEDEECNVLYWQLMSVRTETDTNIQVKDLVVAEYDEHGTYVRNLYSSNFNENTSIIKRLEKNIKTQFLGAAETTNKNGSLFVAGAYNLGQFSVSDNRYLPTKTGYTYKLSAAVKVDNPGATTNVGFRINNGDVAFVGDFDKNYLEFQLQYHLNYTKKLNVPLYIGEFGTSVTTFEYNLGGEQWVRDMLSLFEEYQVNYSYHDYHGGWGGFSLYNSDYKKLPTIESRNNTLYHIFLDMLN